MGAGFSAPFFIIQIWFGLMVFLDIDAIMMWRFLGLSQ